PPPRGTASPIRRTRSARRPACSPESSSSARARSRSDCGPSPRSTSSGSTLRPSTGPGTSWSIALEPGSACGSRRARTPSARSTSSPRTSRRRRPGGRAQVTRGNPAKGFAAPTEGPAHRAARAALAEAYGREVVEMGSGGSIPLVPALTETFPEAELLLLGAMDDRSNIHAQNESVDLAELGRATLGQALMLERLAAGG